MGKYKNSLFHYDKILILSLTIAIILPLPCISQNMIIKSKDGTEQSIQLDSLSFVTFDGSGHLINYLISGIQTNSLSTIRKIYFTDAPIGVESKDSHDKIKTVIIYPNPVNQYLNIQNLPEDATNIEIFGLDSRPVKKVKILSGSIVDISSLTSGSYYLIINNQVIKFIKL
ncbi:MAG: T9SS type A sorting domain-containing protein [bacterium]